MKNKRDKFKAIKFLSCKNKFNQNIFGVKGKGEWGGEGNMHRVIGVDPWSLTMKNEDNHFSLR